MGGSPILGATGNTWTPQGPGSYTVKVIYPNGCVQYSEPFPFVVEVAESVDLENNLLVYPNPTSRFLTIGSNKTIQGKIQYFLTDALGRSHLMGFWNGLSAEENLDLGGLPAGVYTIRIEHASGRFSLLVLKQ